MSYNHAMSGWDKLDALIQLLRSQGVVHHITEHDHDAFGNHDFYDGSCHDGPARRLRHVTFTLSSTLFIAEEYTLVSDNESDGQDIIGFVIYESGHRPLIPTQITEFDRNTASPTIIRTLWH